MAGLEVKTQPSVTLVVEQSRTVELQVGLQGPRGAGGTELSRAAGNALQTKEDGLYAAEPEAINLATNYW